MKIKKILNYTYHPISIITNGGTVEIPKHGMARASTYRNIMDRLDFNGSTIPVNETSFGEVSGLPDYEEGTIIIVSGIAASAMWDKRKDLYVVDEPVRDMNGKIIGCRALSKGSQF